ncbi:hypothetical protein FNT36_12185 [Hymenobacter setariae]|uniref:Uncharacterized protein n=1 Tax=Hymenobacter setariae TaxID=2594794 RepID=A0A558BUP7_9BACT|nr:hypothetical protein [Hymenobacter setariae]TVT40240.1 hypothetical protein FNT36_12185 [Hymenobacter setariae]
MNCPSCTSDNVQKLSILYELGTNDIRTSSVTTGLGGGLSRGSGLGLGTAHTSTKGTSQSKLASKASPPAKQSYKVALAIVLGILMLLVAAGNGFFLTIALLLIGGGGYLLYRAYLYNNNTWPPKYAIWQQSWHCNRCGDIYSQGA